MNNRPEFIYHYTTFDAAISILKTGTLRMYDINRQSDDFELLYVSDIIFNYLENEVIVNKTKFNENAIIATIYCLISLSKYFTSADIGERLQKLISQLSYNQFQLFNEKLSERQIRFFITSCSKNNNVSYLWENYATIQNGIVLKVKSDYLPTHIGVKPVIYGDIELNKYISSASIIHHLTSNQDSLGIFSELIKSITDLTTRSKQEIFQVEDETRLVLCHDSLTSKEVIQRDFNSNRDFINLPLNKPQMLKRFKAVYYKAISDEQLELIKLVCSKTKIPVIQLSEDI